jgi:hypothetical protein
MLNLFDENDRKRILDRIASLKPSATRQWGKMTPSQALAHLSIAMESAAGEGSQQQALLGKIVTPLIMWKVLDEKPFGHNAPTDPSFVVSDERDFEKERARLVAAIDRLVSRGPAKAAESVHPFFGRLTPDQWGRLTFKHLDHHLRQFGA